MKMQAFTNSLLVMASANDDGKARTLPVAHWKFTSATATARKGMTANLVIFMSLVCSTRVVVAVAGWIGLGKAY